jgi:hypothetical protein
MTVRGKIKNGKVLLDNPKALPDGTEVEVRAVKKPRPAPSLANRNSRRAASLIVCVPSSAKLKTSRRTCP